jgi:hypothetical protein
MWWCPTCKQDVDGRNVTYEEYHETCGTYLGDCQEITDEDKINSCINYLIENNFTPEDYTREWNKNIEKYNVSYDETIKFAKEMVNNFPDWKKELAKKTFNL